jgi:hypothetical protein
MTKKRSIGAWKNSRANLACTRAVIRDAAETIK